MNLYPMLKQRELDNNPVKVGVIGAGKFSSMFLSQARFTPGLQVTGIAELAAERAFLALETTGWEKGVAGNAHTPG
ncbi:MAG: flagellar biosynthesis protein FlgA, partial [Desulfobulbia bacterium]